MKSSPQGSDEIKKVDRVSEVKATPGRLQDVSAWLENDSTLLPHERVGSDFSWLQEKTEEDISAQKAHELEEEESFLYGTEASQSGEHSKQEKMGGFGGTQQSSSVFGGFDQKRYLQTASHALTSLGFNSVQCEKLQNMLNNLGASSDAGRTTMKTVGQQDGNEPAACLTPDTAVASLSNPGVRKALESLQSLIKG